MSLLLLYVNDFIAVFSDIYHEILRRPFLRKTRARIINFRLDDQAVNCVLVLLLRLI